VIAFAIASPYFATTGNLLLVLQQAAVNGIIAIGMTVVIIGAGIDLSVGSVLALAGVFSALCADQAGSLWTIPGAFLLPILTGVFAGVLNGVIVSRGRVAPLIATLGTMTAFRGFVEWYRINPVYNLQSWYTWIGQASVVGVPVPVFVFAAVGLAASLMLNRTIFGRHVYAVGGNEEAARASGINVANVKLATYVISGVCVGIAAVVSTARIAAGESTAGTGFELQAIAAAVIGGASLFGGIGRISGTVAGAVIMAVLFNGLVLLNVPYALQQMVIGGIIIGAVWLDAMVKSREHSALSLLGARRRRRRAELPPDNQGEERRVPGGA
jgi:ribose/xylose/arabinose/galactoside ABC-type transport system permease subunit